MSYIISEQIQGVLKLTLNRPDKFNSFNREMALQLIAALDNAANDKTVRALLLTGEGKAFCAGQDLSEAIDPNGIRHRAKFDGRRIRLRVVKGEDIHLKP